LPISGCAFFSGGIYKGNASAGDVARYNLMGLEAGFKVSAAGISLVEFEFSEAKQWLQPVD